MLPAIKNDNFKNTKMSDNYKIIYQFPMGLNDEISSQLKELDVKNTTKN